MAEKDVNLLFNQFEIKIIDNGMGISKEGLKNLFVDFKTLGEH